MPARQAPTPPLTLTIRDPHLADRHYKKLLQMLLQEVNSQRPGLSRRLLIAHPMIGIEESVTGIVHFHRNVLPGLFIHTLDLPHLLHGITLIPAAIEGQYWRVDLRHFFRGRIVSRAIERNNGP